MSYEVVLLDDDQVFAQTLQRQFQRMDCTANIFHDTASLLDTLDMFCPQLIILDLNLGSSSSLAAIPPLRSAYPNAIILMLTGYGSIATCVNAIKAGADDYLTKPVSFQTLYDKIKLLIAENSSKSEQTSISEQNPTLKPMSASQLEWEHIQAVLKSNQGNISQTARVLNMHRRTLQRKLYKRAPS
ncbi:response regulator transcription factor [Catenovulum adriaticum]|uniref:Response regulator n=1 Tax=Catenovulum adriaticum TaxID=2984846 RepID=A0ABY7ANR3_9ALTE|nr:response regulator [Catenovulum sp. TS8]WAJ70907.1 response regulator [Catenovulum sp. TS8]